MTDTRDSFEKWFNDKYPNMRIFGKSNDGEYYSRRVNTAWEAWQAALQSGAGDSDRLEHLVIGSRDQDCDAISGMYMKILNGEPMTMEEVRNRIDASINAQATEGE